MSKHLLTDVITDLVNEYSNANEYGVSLITIPDFDYAQFAQGLSSHRKSELYFLGFSAEQKASLMASLPNLGEAVKYSYTVEEAEISRNSGNEEIFRVLVIKRAEIEKISSLRWFPEITLEKVYTKSCDYVKFDTFSRLCARADVIDDFSEPLEETMQKAFARLCTIDSRRLIKFLLNTLSHLTEIDFNTLSDIEKRMMQMFYVSVWLKAADDWNSDEVLENLYVLADSPVLLGELIDLLQYNYDHIDFIDKPVNVGFDCPLDLHCTYTRDQLLVALDFMKPSTVREGVKWLPEKNIDVFFVTLNKADKDYSPTTMYNDYSINSELFHWQSQSTTAADSPTGQRYIHHREKGSRVLLFVREFKSDRISGSAAAYTYLGTANYVKHDGEKPMNITWKLDHPIPAKYLKKTNKLVVG